MCQYDFSKREREREEKKEKRASTSSSFGCPQQHGCNPPLVVENAIHKIDDEIAVGPHHRHLQRHHLLAEAPLEVVFKNACGGLEE